MDVVCGDDALGYALRQGARRLGRGAADGRGGREFVSAAERDQSREGAQSRARVCVARCRAHARSNGANGYLDIHPLFVYKPMQNTSGMEWISAVEALVVGYKAASRRAI